MADFRLTTAGADAPTFTADTPVDAMSQPGVGAGTHDVWVKAPDALIVPTLTSGTIDASDISALVVTGSNAPDGGNTAYSWETSPDGSTWTEVATTAGYDASALGNGTQIRRGVSTGSQSMVFTTPYLVDSEPAVAPNSFSNFTPDVERGWFSFTSDINDGTILAVSNTSSSMTGTEVEAVATTSIAKNTETNEVQTAIQVSMAAAGTSGQYAHIVQKTAAGAYGPVNTYGPFTIPSKGTNIGAGALSDFGADAQINFPSLFPADVESLSFLMSYVKMEHNGFNDIWDFDHDGPRDGKNRYVMSNAGGTYFNFSDGVEESGQVTGLAGRAGDLVCVTGSITSDGAGNSIINASGYFMSGGSPGWRKIIDGVVVTGLNPIDVGGQTLAFVCGWPSVWYNFQLAEGTHDDEDPTVRDSIVTGTNVLVSDNTAWETATSLTAALKCCGGADSYNLGENHGTGSDATSVDGAFI